MHARPAAGSIGDDGIYVARENTQVGARQFTRLVAFAIRDFVYRETEGELLALLLEDAVIKQLQPRFNERQRDYLECWQGLRNNFKEGTA